MTHEEIAIEIATRIIRGEAEMTTANLEGALIIDYIADMRDVLRWIEENS